MLVKIIYPSVGGALKAIQTSIKMSSFVKFY